MNINFRNIAKFIAAVAGVAATFSCSKELAPDPEDVHIQHSITAKATMPQDNTWVANDEIKINNGNSLTAHALLNNNKTAEFSGTVEPYRESAAAGADDIYWAVYPTTIYSSSNNHNLTITFPASQSIDSNVYIAGYEKIAHDNYYVDFEMKNLGAQLQLTLKSTTEKVITSLVFHTMESGKYLSGQYTVSASDLTSNGNFSMPSSGGDITVNLGSGITINSSSSNTVYVIFPPIDASANAIKMTVYANDDTHATTYITQNFQRSKAYPGENTFSSWTTNSK